MRTDVPLAGAGRCSTALAKAPSATMPMMLAARNGRGKPTAVPDRRGPGSSGNAASSGTIADPTTSAATAMPQSNGVIATASLLATQAADSDANAVPIVRQRASHVARPGSDPSRVSNALCGTSHPA